MNRFIIKPHKAFKFKKMLEDEGVVYEAKGNIFWVDPNRVDEITMRITSDWDWEEKVDYSFE